jgi:uncharacterized phage-associated protein
MRMRTAIETADWIVTYRSEDLGLPVDPMTLEKLLFYGRAFHLGLTGTPLFDDELVAWTSGPIVRSVWARYGHLGPQAIAVAKAPPPAFDPKTETFLRDLLSFLSAFTALQLSYATHLEDPWREARLGSHRKDTPRIPKERLGQYYAALMIEGESILTRHALLDSVPQPRWGWLYIAGIYARLMRHHPFFVWGLSILGSATKDRNLPARSLGWSDDPFASSMGNGADNPGAWPVNATLTQAEIQALLRPPSGGRKRRIR